jgi:hypothetical protein
MDALAKRDRQGALGVGAARALERRGKQRVRGEGDGDDTGVLSLDFLCFPLRSEAFGGVYADGG